MPFETVETTLTVHLAVLLLIFAVIVQEPTATAFTTPPETVAILLFEDAHCTFLLELDGFTVALRV
jgi:hypothetical protein